MLLFLAFLCLPLLEAQDGLRGAMSRGTEAAQGVTEFSAEIAAADFDDDHDPDGAILLETGSLNGKRSFRIEVHVTEAANSNITFSSAESGLAISALDVNQDGTPDIVIEKAFTHQRLQVYLNNGHGTFRAARAEDYPSPDPLAPNWRPASNTDAAALCLLISRSSETRKIKRAFILARTVSMLFSFWPEALLAQSAARAPSSSRAPPALLSL
jgi:hypothetical protein